MEILIKQAYDEPENIKTLFREYTAMLGVDLSFQDYDEKIKTLPGKYSPPYGRLYLAEYGGKLAGCAALRPINKEICEMKRLYVKPEYRKFGIGKLLAQTLIDDARKIKYKTILLDTLAILDAAVIMYKKLGFTETEPYYDNPLDNVIYMRMELAANE